MFESVTPALRLLGSVIEEFKLESLQPAFRACESLTSDAAYLDVAVLGQFKSGKSSLLNAILQRELFPVSTLPATAVITRTAAGTGDEVMVQFLDGSKQKIPLEEIGDYVTETKNPHNNRNVAVVDVLTPAMKAWPGVRLVDTPGLGSVFHHNTEATRAWLPNVAVALVAVSSDRPLSDEDARLIEEARKIAGRVFMVLTKVDLLTADEQAQMVKFVENSLLQKLGTSFPVIPFSIRSDRERWYRQLREKVLEPISQDVAGLRRDTLQAKVTALTQSCRDYLAVGLQAAQRADSERETLRGAVLNESVQATIIHDELRVIERRMREGTRAAFEKFLLARQANLVEKISQAIHQEYPAWRGSLSAQVSRSEKWMKERLESELTPLSQEANSLGVELMRQAEFRLSRVTEAFQNRLQQNLHDATGLTISAANWICEQPRVKVIPVAVGRTLMMSWEMLSWLLPMSLFGGIFRRHVVGRVPWEVEKNLTRLVSDWTESVNAAIVTLRSQAETWVDTEMKTLDGLLAGTILEAVAYQEALTQLENLENLEW